jgi:hypothetical protein
VFLGIGGLSPSQNWNVCHVVRGQLEFSAEASLRKLLFCQVFPPLQVDAHFIHVLSDVNAKRKAVHTVVITKLMKRFALHAMKQLNF